MFSNDMRVISTTTKPLTITKNQAKTPMKSTARQAADALDKLHKIGQACDAATEKAAAAIRERYAGKAHEVFNALPADVQLAVNHLRNIGVDVDVKSEGADDEERFG